MLKLFFLTTLLALILLPASATWAALPQVILPAGALTPRQLSVIVNDRDSLSVEIGKYYRFKRRIPAENIIHVEFDPDNKTMHPGVFAVMQKVIESKTPEHIQAYALTWAAPYRVGCMSITAAFTFGFDQRYCAIGCKSTAWSPYARSDSKLPFSDFGIRPTMAIAADNFPDAKALIDRGVKSDGSQLTADWTSQYPGAAYLVETPDKNRNVRHVFFPQVKRKLGHLLPIYSERSEGIRHRQDVMFYFTGDKFVDGINSNRYLPGAMADHLTSSGGQLTDSRQMSAMRWLESGVTGSYGTVVEPCNLLAKFPNPYLAMKTYLMGSTLLEAYWKSVEMPGQGIFIGEPLASPYGGYQLHARNKGLRLTSPLLTQGSYKIYVADSIDGPFDELASIAQITPLKYWINLQQPLRAVYKVEPVSRATQSTFGY